MRGFTPSTFQRQRCAAAGCERPSVSRQRCTLHAQRLRKYGSDNLPRRLSDDERFDASYVLDPATGCHVWMRGRDSSGYGQFYATDGGVKRAIRAHRYAWQRKFGAVPEGLVLDHIACDNKACCNPDHLQAVSNVTNTMRAPLNPSVINLRKTSCIRGHEFTPENTYLRPDGKGKQCRVCIRLRSAS